MVSIQALLAVNLDLHAVNLTNEYFLLLIAIAVLSTSPGLRKEKKIGQDNNCELERVY